MKSTLAFIAAGLAACASASGTSHPTLPTMWVSTVNEAEVGLVSESYLMVDRPTPANPSGKWTNFTDGSCQRLIYDGNNYNQARYLLGCDALPCCTETQSGNHLEYQIPNIHPAFLTKVSYGGNVKLNQNDGGKTVTTQCDVWSWSFGPAKYFAYTSAAKGSNATTLNRWIAEVEGKNFTNDYFEFTAVPDANKEAFSATFNPPGVCDKAPSCGDAFEQGLLTAEHLRFARHTGFGPHPNTVSKVMKLIQDKKH